ncbi:MAG: MFS transporter [Actinomycetota bacterium]|nr:MFS transporter [Actinomycetota bacterium]
MPPEPATETEPRGTEPRNLGGPAGQGAAAPPTAGLRHAVRALRHRDFAIFWSGALASNTGTWVQNLTVPYVLYEITSSAFWVGFATFAQFIPVMLLGPLAGSIADRYDRRHILIVTQSLMALAALALWATWAAGVRELAPILGLVTLSGLLAGINIPSWQSFVNDLVPREDLLSAVTLNSLQFNAARAFGPAIAGVLLATLGAGWAFLVNGISFVCVLVGLALVHTRPPRRTSPMNGGFLRQFGRAVRYTRSQPGIVIGMVVAVLVGALGNPIQQFTVVFAADEFDVGPLGLSFLNVALGVGAVMAAPIVSGWDGLFSRATIVRWSLLAYGGSVIAFALAPTYLVGLLALIVAGGGFLAVISTTNTAVQVIVADHIRGRVMAFRIMAFTGAYPLGALVQGWLADQIGARATVGGAGAILLGAAVALASRPALLGRLDDAHDESPGADGD